MKTKHLWIAWGAMYLLCTLLSFNFFPTGSFQFLMTFFALAFFVPGGVLLYYGLKHRNRKLLRTVRLISAGSLGLTLVVLVLNFLSALIASEAIGMALYILLLLVSTPMMCSGVWVVSLFLWACLLMATFLKPKK